MDPWEPTLTCRDKTSAALDTKMQQQDPIVQACGMGDLRAVRNFISKGSDINSPGTKAMTPLYAASQGYKAPGPDGHLEVVQLLIAAGANPNTPVTGGSTPLHLAAELGLTKVAQSLLAAGAHTEVFKDDGFTPLHVACMKGHPKVVDLLLRGGAGVDTVQDDQGIGPSPLYLACQQGHSAVVRLLLAAGADKEASTRFGHTPLVIAIIMDRLDIIQLLLQAGANMEVTLKDQPYSYQNGMTPLIFGAECKREAACIMLLAAGADPNRRTDEGKSAFDYLPSLESYRPAADGTRPVVLGAAAAGPPAGSRDQLMAKSIRELKELLLARGCSMAGLLYKADLVDRLLQE